MGSGQLSSDEQEVKHKKDTKRRRTMESGRQATDGQREGPFRRAKVVEPVRRFGLAGKSVC